ncbi:MAG: hypothetical protein K1X75_10670 [Leptospirales bacterium]|nr:hypothetical protein [Leptospirales bacterium]
MEGVLIEARLEQASARGVPVELRGYTFSRTYQRNLDTALRVLLTQAGRPDLAPILHSVAQELCLFASIANMRQVYFEERGLNLSDALELSKNEEAFQSTVSSQNEMSYRERVRRRGLQLRTRLEVAAGAMVLEVSNNAYLSPAQEERLRGALREAMEYRDIMDYFRDHPDDPTGRGLGLTLSLLMLREQNLRPELLRVGRSDGWMVSRLEAPLTEMYQSIRDRIARGEEVRPFEAGGIEAQGVQLQDIITVQCPVCGRMVDERVFFIPVDDSMIDAMRVRAVKPDWQPDHGACASCLASFG